MPSHSGLDQNRMQGFFRFDHMKERRFKKPGPKKGAGIFYGKFDPSTDMEIKEYFKRSKIILADNLKSFAYSKRMLVILTGLEIAAIGYEGVKILIKQDGYYQEDGSMLPFEVNKVFIYITETFGYEAVKHYNRINFH